jgi:hypothetical protein
MKLKELNQQNGSFYKQASIASNALLASHKVAHTIAEELVLPAAVDMVNIMIVSLLGSYFQKCGNQQAHPSC